MGAALRAHFVNRENVRMIEGRSRAGLVLKASQSFLVVCKFRRQSLDRNLAAELGVFSEIYFAHAAHAEEGNDRITIRQIAATQIWFR